MTACDKQGEMFVLACVGMYGKAAWQYIDSQKDTYIPAPTTEHTIVMRIAKECERFGDVVWFQKDTDDKPTKKKPEMPTKSSHFDFLFKFHKNPIGLRPISANPNTGEVPTARVVNVALKFIEAYAMDRIWHDEILVTSGDIVPRSSVMIGCDQMHIRHLNSMLSRGHLDINTLKFAVYDFTSMYTKFPHGMIKNAVNAVLTYAFRAHAASNGWTEIYLATPHHDQYQYRSCYWTAQKDLSEHAAKTHKTIDLTGLIARVAFLVDNSYVFFGGQMFHQQIGIAMGLIPAGLIANMVCFYYEAAYLRRCLRRYGDLKAAPNTPDAELRHQKNRCTFIKHLKRYIDDCLFTLPNGYDPQNSLYDERTAFDGTQDGTDVDGIYPSKYAGPNNTIVNMPCELERVAGPARSVNFLDWILTVDVERNRIMTETYDKRHDMPLFAHTRTFPHISSLLPMRVKLNVITSQLIRFARRSSTLRTPAHAAARLVASFLDYGYPRAPVTNKVRSFLCHWKHATHLG